MSEILGQGDRCRPRGRARRRRRCAAPRARPCPTATIAWLFIAPTIVLLLAINIFPLIWTIYLSFTNYRPTGRTRRSTGVGTEHYTDILTDPDVWHCDAGDGAFRLLDDRRSRR